jgi:hypothetical protein
MADEDIIRTQEFAREFNYELMMVGRGGAIPSAEGRWIYGKVGFGLADIKEDGSLGIDYNFSYVEVLDEQLGLMDDAKEMGIPVAVANVGKTREEVKRRRGLLESCLQRLDAIQVEEGGR